jgi:hypothetical protein
MENSCSDCAAWWGDYPTKLPKKTDKERGFDEGYFARRRPRFPIPESSSFLKALHIETAL